MENLNNTLAAIDSLNQTPAPSCFDSPDYELLEEFYTRPYDYRHDPLLARTDYCDPLWAEIEKDSQLMLLFRWLICPVRGRLLDLQSDSEIPALRLLLADVLTLQSDLPALKQKAAKLLDWLRQKGLVDGL